MTAFQACRPCAMAHPDFARSVNPISTRGGDRLCPPNYYWHTRIFRPSDGPGYITHARAASNQSYYIEVAQGAIFMEQIMRFRLILGQLAILKKSLGPIMRN